MDGLSGDVWTASAPWIGDQLILILVTGFERGATREEDSRGRLGMSERRHFYARVPERRALE
jgi:hypothetical protein